MRFRIIFFVVLGFFLTMNVLLWRSEFAPNSRFGSTLPAEVVWEKLLTSPDDSWLDIRHRGSKIGRAHWTAKINEDFPEDDPELALDLPPEGMISRVTGYTLDFGGHVLLDEVTRLRFDCGLSLDTNQAWQSFTFKFLVKPFSLEIRSIAREQKIRVVIEDDGRKEYVYSFEDLRNPDKILRDLGGPLLPATLGAFTLPLRQLPAAPASASGPGANPLGFTWQARHDRMQLGRTDVRVYRIEARVLGRYGLVFLVSPIGEVLRIELPDEIILTNDALTNF
jgi:hypothetical protein